MTKKIKSKKVGKIVANFNLRQIVWKSNLLAWNMVLGICEELNEAFINYSAKFIFNKDPYVADVDALKEDILQIQREIAEQLFEDGQRERIADIRKEMIAIKKMMKEEKAKCPDIEFQATAVKIDWTGHIPIVTFAVDDDLIEKLNREKGRIGQYKIELTPIKNK